MGKIIDISHHQDPASIDYDQLAKELDLAIIRTQYGSATLDKYYLTHHAELRKRNVPTNAYAWVRGVNISDMEKEALDFYNRTKDINPEVWWLDVEEQSMTDMRGGVSAYIKKLRELGVKKIGVYIAHHLYKSFNLDLTEADAVWIPRYGTNNGQPQTKPDYPCDLWQYTSVGKLPGYAGNLDLNMILSDKPLEWFTGKTVVTAGPTPTAQPVSGSSAVLKKGDKGEAVRAYQQKLLDVGEKLPRHGADGDFGDETEAATKAFQARYGLAVDGIAGPKTFAKLEEVLKSKAAAKDSVPYPGHLIKKGSTGKDVERVQRAVGVTADGIFGSKTEAAVKAYQSRHGLTADGIVGPKTWSVMF